MKKKLNLLWNLKFNFFSVAERPLTFFAYFLNAKKVGRRRLVIVPATAGGLPLFPHAASAFTPALAPVRSHFACGETGLAGYRPHLLGLPRKSGHGISLRETTLCGCPLRGHGFATPHRCFAVPVTAAPRRGPNGKTPALAPVRSHFACGETGLAGHRPHRGRRFAVPVTAAPRRGPNGKTPALVAVRLHFACAKPRGRTFPPPGATCSLPHFRFAQMWPRIFPRGLPGYVPLFHGWPRARTPALSSVSS